MLRHTLVCTALFLGHHAWASNPVNGVDEYLTGEVTLNANPVAKAEVTLFKSGPIRREGAIPLATTTTDKDGGFEFTYQSIPDDGSILYLVAEREYQRVATILGGEDVPVQATLNELTTVATAYVMNQFLDGKIIGGNSVGIVNSASVFRNLIQIESGAAAEVISTYPNGDATDALSKFNTLGNILAHAAAGPREFLEVSSLAVPPCGSAPGDLLELAAVLARFPASSPAALFNLSKENELYQPALQSALDEGENAVLITWTLMLTYGGDPSYQLDGPGFIVVDDEGTIWIANNFEYAESAKTPVCSGTSLTRLAPDGELYGSGPYSGGGLKGPGFGLGFDTQDRVWVGNFGFQGNGATCSPGGNSVSLFTSTGEALSPDSGDNPNCDAGQGGFCNGNLDGPQGVASDSANTIWIANLCSGSMTKLPDGDPLQAYDFALVPQDVKGEPAPFGVAIDGGDRAWVTDNGASTVYCVKPDDSYEEVVPSNSIDFKRPLGTAVDSLGNVWIADSGIIPIADGGNCTERTLDLSGTESRYGELNADEEFAGIMRVTPDGRVANRYTGGGLSIPWGVAIDGDDHVWIADFNGNRVSQFCGANQENWPCGLSVGDPISPANGYRSSALERSVSVAIDQSGNVWLSNNFLIDCLGVRDANPGGKTVVQFLGMAAPVAAPLIGIPHRPETAVVPDCPADFNGDGSIDGADLARMLGSWGFDEDWHDLSGDSEVDGADLARLLEAWGSCDRSGS